MNDEKNVPEMAAKLDAVFDEPLVSQEQREAFRAERQQKSFFKTSVLERFWDYRLKSGLFKAEYFDEKYSNPLKSCVFKKGHANHNVLLCPTDTDEQRKEKVLSEIPASHRDEGGDGGGRHRWFRSMSSSQALAQSVFGNLKHYDKLHLLADLVGTDGQPLFIRNGGQGACMLEYASNVLQEPRPTSVDVFFPGTYQVAVECKFCEVEVGTCSRPREEEKPEEHCYKGELDTLINEPKEPEAKAIFLEKRRLAESKLADMKKMAMERGSALSYKSDCILSALKPTKIKYWDFIPQLFTWSTDMTEAPCPLRMPYQLVRNVLMACVRDGKADAKNGHAVLLYDKRNLAFHRKGEKGREAFDQVRAGLKVPSLMQECTWQTVVKAIRKDKDMLWLTDALRDKYGIE